MHQTTSWLVHSWSTFGARTNHKQTQTHKTHHGSNLKEATTFPLIIFFVLDHGASTQMSFCPGIPKLVILKFSKLGLSQLWRPITLCANLQLRRGYATCKIKLYPSLIAFQWDVACHLHKSILRRFQTFNGWKSNWQFNSQPFFWP
jgi:hypothetical protein